jgi:hypothetical protein
MPLRHHNRNILNKFEKIVLTRLARFDYNRCSTRDSSEIAPEQISTVSAIASAFSGSTHISLCVPPRNLGSTQSFTVEKPPYETKTVLQIRLL